MPTTQALVRYLSVFAYLLLNDTYDLSVPLRVDLSTRYMSEPLLASYHPTLINTIHSFLVIYKTCWQPRTGSGVKKFLKAIVHNLEGFDFDDHHGTDDGKASGSDNCPPNDGRSHPPTICDLQFVTSKSRSNAWEARFQRATARQVMNPSRSLFDSCQHLYKWTTCKSLLHIDWPFLIQFWAI